MISKSDMIKFRKQFKDEFAEFFQSGADEMQKIVQLRSAATEICEYKQNLWVADIQKIKINMLTNA